MPRPPALRLAACALVGVAALAGAESPRPHSNGAEAILRAQPVHVQALLQEKKVVLLASDGDGRHVTALVLFAAPEERVMRLLSQTARQREFRSELAATDVIETLPDGTVEQQRMKIMFIEILYHLRYRVDYRARRITWELDATRQNDMNHIEGYWELHALPDGRTLGRFGTMVDAGPALPKSLQDYATRKSVPKTVENARRWVDSDGTWRP